MWWRKKRKAAHTQEAIRQRVVSGIGQIQRRWAFWMQYYELRWTLRQKKIGCIVFCAFFFLAGVAILIQAFL